MDNPSHRQPDLSPVPSPIDFDVPCPQCEYNLRGLTVPRCPECGTSFQWAEIDELKRNADNPPRMSGTKAMAIIALILFSVLCSCIFPILLSSLIFIIFVFSFSALQTWAEFGLASLVLRSPTWKRFRAWWEGVLIGYGLCSWIPMAWGYNLLFFIPDDFSFSRRQFWPVYLTTGLTSLLVQWWVVRQRMRQWNEPIPDRKLWLSCLLAKTVAAAVWIAIPLPYAR